MLKNTNNRKKIIHVVGANDGGGVFILKTLIIRLITFNL